MKIISIWVIPFIFGASSVIHATDFAPNGSISFTQTFYGDAGPYKTRTSHPEIMLSYNFSPQWNVQFEWDRTWNMFEYTGAENEQNNSYSAPKLTLSNNYGKLGNSKVNWSSSLLAKYANDFDGTSQTFILAETGFDFSEYLPKKKYLDITQFAITPMYYYAWNSSGPSGHSNTAVMSLLTESQITDHLSFTFNAYGFRSWNQGNSFVTNPDDSKETSNYFMIISYLNYAKEIHKFNDHTSLDFNFISGFDPWISSNKRTTVTPFLISNEMYEWLSPTVFEGSYKQTFTFFSLPQLQLNYELSKDLSLNFFVQAKYSNQVWGDKEKGWKFQPQGGFSVTHNF
ncbi:MULTISPECIES: hypothetical protein [unclassified Acinetobacter]|uniref:FomA family porin-like outer membrane protein n=1 Tax=unclassified Acinetobacter TaxID=196816 RepID=UPI0029346334|nr:MULTISPECIES: hypothetical protein [unclassified Acinetobacter]WOE30569.1 hypothetical protein QSG84_09210 [Acinetobacter sp. SAAs470]WOE38761.1 hypothetical protein QSG86_02875 [Acinetobacter sp. SAAs474]